MNCTRYVVLGPLLMTVCLGLDAWGSESKAISGALDLLKLGPGYSTSCQDYLELTNDHKLDLIRNVNSQGLKHRIIKHLSLNIPLQCRLSSDVTFETISSLAREFPKLTYDVIRNSRYQQQWEDYGTLMKPEARHDFLEVFQIEKAISSKKCRRQIPATECIGLLLTEAWSHPSKARTYPDLSELLKTISNPNQINTIPDWSIASENIVSVLNLLTKRLVRSSPIDKLEFIQQNQHSLRHVTKHNLAPFSQQTELICGSLRDVFKLRASSPFLISQIEAIAFAQTVFCSKASLVHETQNYLLDAISLGENPAKDRKMNQIIDRNAFGIDFDAESRSALLQKTIASGINRRLESQVLLFQNAIEYGSYSNTRLLSRLLGERQEFYRYLLAHQSDIHRPMADIRRLRELSTRMSQEMESFFFVKEAIHNQFGPGIKSLVREYRNKHLLSFSAEFTKSYDELEALLAELFTEAKNQALMVSNARSSQCCEGLLGLLDGSEELGQRIDDMEANWETMATQQNSDHLTNNYQDYFTLHQNLLKQIGLHSPETIMAKIPDFDDRLLSHLNRLFGLNADSFESFSDALRHMYQRESIPFQWLLAAKAYRAKLGNDELKFQLFNRARFLVSPIIENELRHIGIHYLAKFFEKERSGIRILNKGISRGLVTFVDASDLKRHAYHTQQILVTNGMPNNLGTVAALVTTVPQPIGSHIDLRTKENGIPNAYINDAYKRLKVWDGKWIRLDLTQGDIDISPSEKVSLPDSFGYTKLDILAINKSVDSVLDLTEAHDTKALPQVVGAKASNYARLLHLPLLKDHTPPAIAIPFSYYSHRVVESGVHNRIRSLLEDPAALGSTELWEDLKDLRKQVKKMAKDSVLLNSDWLKDLERQLWKLANKTQNHGIIENWSVHRPCFRLRSSTNTEDLLGFTGAGLYKSKTVCLKPGSDKKNRKRLLKAMTKVWASLWSYRAFQERSIQGINHEDVGMAILIHRNFKHEANSGVLITGSELDPNYLITVNRQDQLVTNPNTDGGQMLEFTATKGKQGWMLPHNPTLGSEFQFQKESQMKLLDLVVSLKSKFQKDYKDSSLYPILRYDVEFKTLVENQRTRLIIKQIRPFTSHVQN